MQKMEGCVCTFRRLLSQIQQFDMCSLRVQRLPALNHAISCNCHSLVSTWLMPKYSREGKKEVQWTPRLLMKSTFSERLISGRRPHIKGFCFNISGCRRSVVKLSVLYFIWICSSDQQPKNTFSSGVIEVIFYFFYEVFLCFFLLGLLVYTKPSAAETQRIFFVTLNLGPPWMWMRWHVALS